MYDPFTRLWNEIAARPSGPFAFRFYLQPAMAILFAVRDGLRDSRSGRAPYFWRLFKVDSQTRRAMIRDGWGSVRRIFILAIAMDVAYQILVLHGLRPVESLVVATVLAIVPYVTLRGPANRLAHALSRMRHRPRHAH